MAITKSAKKAIRNSGRKHVFNQTRKKGMTDVRKEIEKLVSKKDIKAAATLLPKAYQAVDKALKRGILKKNTAARRKARLAKLVNVK